MASMQCSSLSHIKHVFSFFQFNCICWIIRLQYARMFTHFFIHCSILPFVSWLIGAYGLQSPKDLWPIKWVDNSLFFSVLLTTIMELAVKLCTLTKWQQAETPYTMEVLNLFPHKGKSISDISSTTSPHQAHLDSLPCQTDIEIIRVFHLPDTLGHKMALCVVMAGVLLSLSASGRLPVTALRPVCY